MVLIFGSSGFIGSLLCSFLKKNGVSYKIIERQINKNSHHNNNDSIELKWPDDISSLELEQFSSIIYLSYATIHQSMSQKEIEDTNIFPVMLLIDRIKKSNPLCQLIFISSQSALAQKKSKYGKMKFEVENLIKKSKIFYTIVRPGLVVGTPLAGLFGKIYSFVKKSPVIPMIIPSESIIQPVVANDILLALKKIVEVPSLYRSYELNLAISPVKFNYFLRSLANVSGSKHIFLPVPYKALYLGLSLIECFYKNAPLTTTNLFGLLYSEVMSIDDSWNKLNIKPSSLESFLQKIKNE